MLLHKEYSGESHARDEHHISSSQPEVPVTPVSSHAAMGIKANMLLMTCYNLLLMTYYVQVKAPDGL